MKTTLSSSSCSSASCAHTKWPMCGGLNAPPRIPIRKLLANLARALDDELVRGQLTQSDRAPGVELLGRVADLGAHPEHRTVGEAGRGVDVHGGGVHALRERPRGVGGAGDDRLRMARAVTVHVLDRLIGRVD